LRPGSKSRLIGDARVSTADRKPEFARERAMFRGRPTERA
jgi:hypothetical protein